MSSLTIESKILVGAESKQWLADLTKQMDRMEALTKKGMTTTATASAIEETEEEDEDFAEAPVKTKGKAAASASFDDEDEDEITAGQDDAPVAKSTKGKKSATSFDDEGGEEDEAPAPAKKTTKAKKVTIDEVNDACKARVTREIEARGITGKEARTKVLSILSKKFKVTSVSELKPEQFQGVIEAMAAAK